MRREERFVKTLGRENLRIFVTEEIMRQKKQLKTCFSRSLLYASHSSVFRALSWEKNIEVNVLDELQYQGEPPQL